MYRGYVLVRVPAGRWRSLDNNRIITIPKGMLDYVAIHANYPGLFIEAKRPGGELRPDQVTKIYELEQGYKLGVAVVDSPQELSEYLNDHEQRAGKRWLEIIKSGRGL